MENIILEKEIDKYYESFFYQFTRKLLIIKNYILKYNEFLQYQQKLKSNQHSSLFSPIDNLFNRRKYKGIIIYPPTIEWNIPLIQRPQHLAKAIAKRGYLFIYCTNNSYDNVLGYEEISDNVILTNQYSTIINKIHHGWILFQASHSGYTLSDLKKWKLLGYKILYEYIDEIDPKLVSTKNHSRILKRHMSINDDVVDLAIVSSKRLHNDLQKRIKKNKIVYIPNGVDFRHFQDIPLLKKVDLNDILDQGKPIIGYYGALAEWIDYDLIRKTAIQKQDWNFVFIGWDFDGSIQKIIDLKNIYYLGIKDYKDLPWYLSKFDVCLIPFKVGNIAKSTSPLKLFEYMSGGKQVVVTKDLDECKNYSGVYISNTQKDFISNLTFALSKKNNKLLRKKLVEQGKNGSWDQRAKILDSSLQSYINKEYLAKRVVANHKISKYRMKYMKEYNEELQYKFDKLKRSKLYSIWKNITER